MTSKTDALAARRSSARPPVRVTVERGSRSGRMVHVRRVDTPSAVLWVQRRRVEWPEGPSGPALFRPTDKERTFRGWAD